MGDEMNNMNVPAISPQMQVAINDAPFMKCQCGGIKFEKAMAFKKLSRFMTGDTEDSLVPIPLYVCRDCGRINVELARMMGVPENIIKSLSSENDSENSGTSLIEK